MWLIVGLGNPDKEYELTRHNIGFMAVDYLVDLEPNQGNYGNQFKSHTLKTNLAGQPVLFIKPQTFMNRSGTPVQAAMAFYKAPIEKVVVIHDDLDLELGQIKVKKGGGHGGHNGLRDIMRLVGDKFTRIRLGIGKPNIKGTEANYVLSNFRDREISSVEDELKLASEAVKLLLEKDADAAQMKFNQKK